MNWYFFNKLKLCLRAKSFSYSYFLLFFFLLSIGDFNFDYIFFFYFYVTSSLIIFSSFISHRLQFWFFFLLSLYDFSYIDSTYCLSLFSSILELFFWGFDIFHSLNLMVSMCTNIFILIRGWCVFLSICVSVVFYPI